MSSVAVRGFAEHRTPSPRCFTIGTEKMDSCAICCGDAPLTGSNILTTDGAPHLSAAPKRPIQYPGQFQGRSSPARQRTLRPDKYAAAWSWLQRAQSRGPYRCDIVRRIRLERTGSVRSAGNCHRGMADDKLTMEECAAYRPDAEGRPARTRNKPLWTRRPPARIPREITSAECKNGTPLRSAECRRGHRMSMVSCAQPHACHEQVWG